MVVGHGGRPGCKGETGGGRCILDRALPGAGDVLPPQRGEVAVLAGRGEGLRLGPVRGGLCLQLLDLRRGEGEEDGRGEEAGDRMGGGQEGRERRQDRGWEGRGDREGTWGGEDGRLVLLGRTGAGRRAAGNTILGREEFGAQDSPSAVTQRSRRREGDVCGRRLVLVDTPDWFCPGLSLEEMRQDVGQCVRLSAPGLHAFLSSTRSL